MGKAIVEGLVPIIIVGIIAMVVVYYRRKASKEKALASGWAVKGDLSASQEKEIIAENNKAAIIFRSMLAPTSDWGSDMTILSNNDRQSAESWIAQYNKRRG